MAENEEGVSSILENAKHNFQQLTSIQRMGLVALLAFGLAAIPVLMLMGREPDMTVLFSNLEDADIQAIVGRLEAQQIPFSMVGNGNTLLVPNDRVHELRMQMAGEGLPEASGVGFEIFDRTSLGVGEFAQKINFRRALQGELARTIGQMPSIQRARVHIVIPERRLFSKTQEPARAAIVVTPRRGGTLTKLVERAGCSTAGSITAFYSVLVEGDDENEPIADSMRGLLDGHIWLSRELAQRGHYPAIDILGSISRLMPDLASDEHRDAAQFVRELLAAYRDQEDLISIGAYRAGSNPMVDLAIAHRDIINAFLRQKIDEASSVDSARDYLLQLKQRFAAQAATPPVADPSQPAATPQ